jgi:hypothetical protein
VISSEKKNYLKIAPIIDPKILNNTLNNPHSSENGFQLPPPEPAKK